MQYRWRKGFKNANEVAKFIAPFAVTKQEKLLQIVNLMSIKRRIKFKKTKFTPWVNEDEELYEDLAKSFRGEKDNLDMKNSLKRNI